MAKGKKRRRSIFVILAGSYALLAAVGSWMMDTRLSKGMSSLILFGLVPVVLVAWIVDAIRAGEMWRQGPRSVSASLTMNESRVTRNAQPIRFWLMICLTAAFALAIFAFVVIGIYSLLIVQP